MSQLQVLLFGIPEIQLDEHVLTFPTRKSLALLTYLAVEARPHSRKTLSERFWPELDTKHGRTALRTTLLQVRTLLERSAISDGMVHLHAGREHLSLDPNSHLVLDLHLVESACRRIRDVEQQGELLTDETRSDVLAQIEQASRLVRGPFLENFSLSDSQYFDDWTRQQREHWNRRIDQLFDSLSKLYDQAGKKKCAIEVVKRWLSYDPTCEEGYRRLMRLYFSQGDRNAALHVYATCRFTLTNGLEIELEPETVTLAQHMRRTAPIRAAQSWPSRRSDRLDTQFVGRAAEFGTLIRHYQEVYFGQTQLVLLEGAMGIGKTRLATEFLGWAQAHR